MRKKTIKMRTLAVMLAVFSSVAAMGQSQQKESGVRRQESGVGSQEGWYTLQGVKVSKPTRKGVYIHNGKLILH